MPAANSKKTAKPKAKRKATPASWKKGQSGNPNGRPKDGESWAGIVKEIGNLYPEDILEFVGKTNDLGKAINRLPKNVQMKYLVTIRVFAQLMFEPTAGLLNGLMDRAEGKVKEQILMDATLHIDNFEKALETIYGGREEEQEPK